MPDRKPFNRWVEWSDLDEDEFINGYVEGEIHKLIPRNMAEDIQMSSLAHSSSWSYFKRCDHTLRMNKTLSALQEVYTRHLGVNHQANIHDSPIISPSIFQGTSNTEPPSPEI